MPAYGKQIKPAEMSGPGRFPGQPAPGGQEPARPAAIANRDDSEDCLMNPTFDACPALLAVRAVVVASLLLAAGVYLRGWLVLHRRDARRWPRGQPIAFLAGLAALFLALASPIEPFTSLLLQVHMVQHLLLMMVAPPLLWLGAPLFPLLLGLAATDPHVLGRPAVSSRFLRRTFQRLTHPRAGLAALHRGHLVLALPADL